jgi:hypothetical protein
MEDEADAETRGGFRRGRAGRETHHGGERENVGAGEIAKAGDEGIGKTEADAVVVGGLSEKEKGQDGERRALAPAAGLRGGGGTDGPVRDFGRRVSGADDADRADEAVALADDSFEETRVGGVVAESGTDFADDVVDVGLGVDEKLRAPQFGDDFFAGDELVAAAEEKNEQVHGLTLELDAMAVAAKLVAAEVEFDAGIR